MAGTRVLVAAAMMLPSAVALAACVEVPDNVRAHFADTRADERSNFRRGPKGLAPPVEPPSDLAAPAARLASAAPAGGEAPAVDAGEAPAVDASGVAP